MNSIQRDVESAVRTLMAFEMTVAVYRIKNKTIRHHLSEIIKEMARKNERKAE